jgi:hypothetical protein
MALQTNATGADVVQIKLDVALDEDDFIGLLERLDEHPHL